MVNLSIPTLAGVSLATVYMLRPIGPMPVFQQSTLNVPFINPTHGGGSFLDKDSGGLGEPLNVIISGLSSPWVLSDHGFMHFASAIGFGVECLDLHLGAPQMANLGDGNGWVNQTMELRQHYGNRDLGTCWESILGGNHLRVWRQNGTNATTNALFLAVSEEEDIGQGHQIKPNGYDLGRENLVQSAVGQTNYTGVKYQTDVSNLTGLIPPGSTGVNHNISIDGVIALLTVTVIP